MSLILEVGGNATLQSGNPGLTTASNRTFAFNSGTGTIDPGAAGVPMTIPGTVSGTATLNKINSGKLVLTGSESFTGTMLVSSGTLTLQNPTWVGTNAGTNTFTLSPGATLELNTGTNDIDSVKNPVTINGTGTLLKSGTAALDISNGNLAISLGQGSLIDISSGLFENGGMGGNGIVWTNNLASMEIDSGGTFDPWDNTAAGTPVMVDVLSGSGALSKNGFGTGAAFVNIGVANGTGTFAGTISNNLGTMNIIKTGSGVETFTGTNSYSGQTTITGSNGLGGLRITNNSGLGWGGQAFVLPNGAAQFSTVVSGSGTLNLLGGITLNNAVTLNGGRLINSMAGTTSILDSGIAGVSFNSDNATAPSGTSSITFTGGSGSGAVGDAGTVAGNAAPLVGGNAQNIFTQMTTAGSGYTPGAGAPTATLTGGVGGTTTVVVSSLTLTGANVLGGDGNLTVNAQVSGAGGFSTVGSGTLTLTGQETYTGSTNVNSGVFAVNGSLAAASVVTVGGASGSGAPTLGGGSGLATGGSLVSPTYTPGTLASKVYASSATVGNVQGAVTVNGPGGGAAGILAPGNSVGTITLGSLTMNAGSIANYEFNGTSNDFTAVTGALSLTGVGFDLYSEGTTSMFTTPGTYALFSYGTTGSITGLSVLNGDTTDFTYVFNLDSTDKLVTLTIAANSGGNASVLAITPSPISLGNVLVNASATGSGTLTNTDGASSANYTMNTSGSIGVTPGSGSNLTPGSTQALSVTGTVGNTSGSNSIVGTISATNTSNGSGNAPSVNVTANIYNVATATPSGNGQTLTNNGAGTLVASAKIQTNTINAASTQNASSWTASSGTIAAGNTGTVETLSPTLLLNGTYHGTANLVVGNVAKDGSAISGATTGDVLNNASYAFSGVVSGNTSTGRGNIYSAQILSGSSYAGYSLGASPGISTHLATGPAANMTTQATLSYGTASAVATVNMSFDNTPAAGAGTDNSFRTSDILTLTGIHSVGTSGAVTLTDKYVLQLSYDNTVPTAGYIGQATPLSGWVNAVSLNSTATATAFANTTYAFYLANDTSGTNIPALGAYGYANGVAWRCSTIRPMWEYRSSR